MSFPRLHAATVSFFAEFDRAFETFDGSVVAARYSAPYLAIRADGTSECFADVEAIAAYFQRVLDAYHQRGCRSCRHTNLELLQVGSSAVFATVTWELLRSNNTVVTFWRESYSLVSFGENLKVCASMDHAE
jgi:hypothetical protein